MTEIKEFSGEIAETQAMSMKATIISDMDLRGLEPPGPLEKALAGIRQLQKGEAARIHTRFRPVFLIEQLEGGGYSVDCSEVEPDHWQTTIGKQ